VKKNEISSERLRERGFWIRFVENRIRKELGDQKLTPYCALKPS